MLTQSSPLNTVEMQCPCAVDDESPEIHAEVKYSLKLYFFVCIHFSDEHDLVLSMHLNNQPFCICLVDVQDSFNLTSGDFHSLWCDCIKKKGSNLLQEREADLE